MANVLAIARRTKRLNENGSIHAWNLLCSLSTRTDERSAYNASCLELAMRSGSALITADEKLGKAATTAGVRVLP
ncbi:MAG: type II toxin-antitoxin system VapC family toxin [Spirochaetaceae bacterium]|nr:type II toxin-antitoxin system VapC family toxin [Spirochaetaceae bacterium]